MEILFLGKRKLKYSYEISDLKINNMTSVMNTLRVLLNLNKVVLTGDDMDRSKIDEMLGIFKQNRISPREVLCYMGNVDELLSQSPRFNLNAIFGLGQSTKLEYPLPYLLYSESDFIEVNAPKINKSIFQYPNIPNFKILGATSTDMTDL